MQSEREWGGVLNRARRRVRERGRERETEGERENSEDARLDSVRRRETKETVKQSGTGRERE